MMQKFENGGIWVWVNTYRYIFRGMNIHKSQLFWCELQRYQGFDTLPLHHVFRWEIHRLRDWLQPGFHASFLSKGCGWKPPTLRKMWFFTPGFIVGFVLFNGRFMFFVEALNISSRWWFYHVLPTTPWPIPMLWERSQRSHFYSLLTAWPRLVLKTYA